METEERKTYNVVTEPAEEGGWLVRVPEVDGAMTQADTPEQIEVMARDVVALLLEVPPDSFDLALPAMGTGGGGGGGEQGG